jgi:hypothetical protein
MNYTKYKNSFISWRVAFLKIFLIFLLLFFLLIPVGCGKKGPPVASFSMNTETTAYPVSYEKKFSEPSWIMRPVSYVPNTKNS